LLFESLPGAFELPSGCSPLACAVRRRGDTGGVSEDMERFVTERVLAEAERDQHLAALSAAIGAAVDDPAARLAAAYGRAFGQAAAGPGGALPGEWQAAAGAVEAIEAERAERDARLAPARAAGLAAYQAARERRYGPAQGAAGPSVAAMFGLARERPRIF